MSAIAGSVRSDRRDDLAALVRSMCESMAHRGPDGIEIIDGGGAVLGQSTLGYRSPFSAEDCGPAVPERDGISAVWDGEIFNGRDLAGRLGLAPGTTAAELIVAAYGEWGTDCPRELDGQFTLAVWDGPRRRLFLARDRLGEKPLYYHASSSGGIVFASEIRAILKDRSVPRDIDHRAVYLYLADKAFNMEDTPLLSVRALPPGHWLVFEEGKTAIGQYWDIPLIADKYDDRDAALKRARDLLLEAVGERVARSAKPAVFLSGGIDSNLLVGVLAALTDRRFMTVTLVSGAHERQVELARRLAGRFNTEHVELTLDGAGFREGLEDFVWSLSKPTPGSIMNYFCSREAAALGADCVLTGHMADSIFAADRFVRNARILDRIFAPFSLLPEKRRTAVYDLMERSLRGAQTRRDPLLRHAATLYMYFRRKRGLSKWYSSGLYPDEVLALFEPGLARREWGSPADLYRSFYHASGSRDMHERLGYAVMKGGSGPTALVNYESIGGRFGLRVHEPFQDQQLVEFARAVPYELRQKGRIGKYIAVELCARFTAREFADQKKGVLSLPFSKWLREDIRTIVDDALSAEALRRRGIFSPESMERLVSRFREGDATLSWADLLAPVILEIWLRLHVDASPRGPAGP